MLYLQLFISFFQIGLFSIGGGYASLLLIQEQVVVLHGWLTLSEFTDLITISQLTPGPIAINSATFVGIQIGGIVGAIVATIGCITPSLIIVYALSKLYFRYKNLGIVNGILSGMRPAVVACIASAAVVIVSAIVFPNQNGVLHGDAIQYPALIMIVIGLYFVKRYKINPTYVMLTSGVLGGILFWIR